MDAPRLLDMRWGKKGPTLTLVGKGVCFDTGGLNLKPGASMGTMKKGYGWRRQRHGIGADDYGIESCRTVTGSYPYR